MTKLIETALKYYGIAEQATEAKNSPTIVKWIQYLLPWAKADEVPWCSAFVNGIALEAGYEHFSQGHGSALARMWLHKGNVVETPMLGDVVVLWRGNINATTGHVGFFIRENATHVFLLGGNQSNQVNIAAFPKDRVLGYRRLNRKA
jgi:uncharacterized protein (TIGR02594 family)